MTDQTILGAQAAPIIRDRITEIDVVRGAALFGVLWMNLFAITTWLVPAAVRSEFASAPADRVVELLSEWLLSNKAQTVFGILFGFGFAVFVDRAAARGGKPSVLFVRRLAILLGFGVVHYVALWWGDILHDYALVGFALPLVRRWSATRLAATGLALIVLTPLLDVVAAHLVDPGHPHAIQAVRAQFHHAMGIATARGDFLGMIHAIPLRTAAVYGDGGVVGQVAELLGQFLLGTCLFRLGVVQRARHHPELFRRVAVVGLSVGLPLCALGPASSFLPLSFRDMPSPFSGMLAQAGTLALAAGYASVAVCANGAPRWRCVCAGLAAVGRMALTNYVLQSVVFLTVFDGFGLGLMSRVGVAGDGCAAVMVFVAQAFASRWWLRRFRFGPLEWLWRSGTYGRWQPFRSDAAPR